jgi:cytochrome b561
MKNNGYTATAKALHWLMALILISAWILGYYSSLLPLSEKIATDSVTIHKSVASVTLFLLTARLIWRLIHGTPEAPPTMGKTARIASKLGHFALYVCMIALPVSGWAWSNSAGYPVPVAGLFHLPMLIEKNKGIFHLLETTHVTLAYVIAVLVLGHIAMALKHHFVDKDSILVSMLPRKRSA